MKQIVFESAGQKLDLLQNFDPYSETWVVSDLRSKFEIQNVLLEKYGAIPSESVVRASEFWQGFLRQVQPHYQFVSKDFLLEVIQSKLNQLDSTWSESPGAAQSLLEYINFLIPIILHENGEEVLREFFEETPGANQRWGFWSNISKKYFNEIKAEGFIAREWAAALLAQESMDLSLSAKKVYFDLSLDFSFLEVDLIESLSKYTEVNVVAPSPSWQKDFRSIFEPYNFIFEKFKDQSEAVSSLSESRNKRVTCKFPSSLAEVKYLTHEVSALIEQGIETGQIVISAPKIEDYWPVIQMFFEQEGIPVAKKRVSRLHSFPSVARWISELKVLLSDYESSHLEVAEYFRVEQVHLKFDEFKRRYANIYDSNDLRRHYGIFEKYQKHAKVSEELSGFEFLEWSARSWREREDLDKFDQLMRRFAQNSYLHHRLSPRSWLRILELTAAQIEVEVSPAVQSGVNILNLNSIEIGSYHSVFLLGLTESDLKKSSKVALLSSEIQILAQKYGFYLDSLDENRNEAEILWALDDPTRNFYLLCSESNFSGEPTAPSWLWIQQNEALARSREAILPPQTNWDRLSQLSLEEIQQVRSFEPKRAELMAYQLKLDENLDSEKMIEELVDFKVSASGIEDYNRCPFVFAAKRLFYLSDLNDVDIDIDAQTKGLFSHRMLEIVLKEYGDLQLSEELKEQIIERVREETSFMMADDRMWPRFKTMNLRILDRFIRYEKHWRERFPDTKTVGFEEDVKGFISSETGELTTEEAGNIPFSGQIDRIDKDSKGHAVILDYKSSTATKSAFPSWLIKGEFQLVLYSLALDSELTQFKDLKTVGAGYFDLKKMERVSGIYQSDSDAKLFEIEKKKKNHLPKEELDIELSKFREKFASILKNIKDGRFLPNPLKVENCKSCQWSKQCRAPHLSH